MGIPFRGQEAQMSRDQAIEHYVLLRLRTRIALAETGLAFLPRLPWRSIPPMRARRFPPNRQVFLPEDNGPPIPTWSHDPRVMSSLDRPAQEVNFRSDDPSVSFRPEPRLGHVRSVTGSTSLNPGSTVPNPDSKFLY
jgi:hypothetical protein